MTDDLVKRLRHAHEHEGIDIERVMHEAADRIAALEAALHQISLGSQNSMTSKEDLGATARRALKK